MEKASGTSGKHNVRGADKERNTTADPRRLPAGDRAPSGPTEKIDYCVAEADEYDRSFLHLAPHIL